MHDRIKHLLCTASVAIVMTVAASAQTTTGAVSGTVTDASGAVIPGAKVAVTNVQTGITVTDTTNNDGIFNARFLQIGQYKIVTTAKGFTTQAYGPFSLEINQVAKVDVKMAIGSESTKVDVTSTLSPLLDTEDNTIATTLTANTIQNVPLSGRNWSSLTLFTPGAIATNPTTFGGSGNQNAIERNQNGGGVSQAQVNGNRAEGNNYRLDGIEINETLNNLVGYNPNPDAIEQLQIISANAPAQYGNVNGGDVLAVTKSGTNKFHGSAAVFLENQLLDANTWANKHFPSGTAFTARNPYTQTQYSATLGGPVIKDKLFFFGDYFGTRYHQGGQTTSSVLSAKMRTGDFSELLDPAIMSPNETIQLYDPSNGYAPFLNNQITITNPVVQYLIAHPEYYPLPNIAPTPGSPVSNNYRGSQTRKIYNDQFDVKVDYTPSTKDRLFVRYSQGKAGDSTTNPIAITFPSDSTYPDKGVAIGYSRTITNAIVNNFNAGYTRIRWNQGDPLDSTGAFGTNGNAVVGIPAAQAFAGFAGQTVTSLTTVGNPAGGTNFIDNTFIYADDLSWQKGKHLLNIGVDIVRYQQNNFYAGNDGANGQFNFTGVFTGDPNLGTTAPGFASADWALDRAAFSGIGSVTGRTGQRQYRSAYYVQDDWKALPNLTFNLGLRYEYFEPIYEVNNKTANYNPDTKTFEYAGSVPTTSGTYPGSTVCKNRSCINSYYNNFMPRLGFAYQATPRLVVRGGFGITKAMEGTGANLRLTYNAPFANSFEANGTNPNSVNSGLFLQETDGFTNPNGGADAGGFPRIEDPNIKPQSTNEYSLTTEYQVNNFSSLKISYVGELSQHLIQAARPNQLTQPCVIDGVVTDPNANPSGCAVVDPAPFLALFGENAFVFQTISEGAANYNGLQVQYRQRTHKGLEYTVNYAYAHAFSNSAGFFGVSGTNAQGPYAQNAYDNHAEWGPTGSDVRNSLNGTAVYELPFGIGKTYASNVNHFVDELIGGWKASMTAIVYSGLPVTVSANNVALVNNQCCSSRPNQISNAKITSHTLNNWFGGITGAEKYSQPVAGTFGDAHNGTERAPGFQQYDMSLFKDFTVYHENRLGFRVDAYNVFNLTSLGNPSNNFSGGNFGQITDVKSSPRQLTLSAKYQF
jgi:outer membrane receptor protein involved in Fe transport